MSRIWRWAVVGSSLAALIALPAVIAARPAAHSDISAPALLVAIQRSATNPYSGYAESAGGLDLPVTSQLNSIADLFGGDSQMRVWWRDPTQWRVDTITATGESDIHHVGAANWTWDYQSQHATLVLESTPRAVRLPEGPDLVPATLARRLLSEATPAEVTRLPSARIAGQSVPGMRMRPADPISTIDEVDVCGPGTHRAGPARRRPRIRTQRALHAVPGLLTTPATNIGDPIRPTRRIAPNDL